MQLELELILSHMTQKPMLRGEVGARALRVRSDRQVLYVTFLITVSLFESTAAPFAIAVQRAGFGFYCARSIAMNPEGRRFSLSWRPLFMFSGLRRARGCSRSKGRSRRT